MDGGCTLLMKIESNNVLNLQNSKIPTVLGNDRMMNTQNKLHQHILIYTIPFTIVLGGKKWDCRCYASNLCFPVEFWVEILKF